MSNLKHFLKRSVAVLLCAGMLSSSALAVESPKNDDGSHFEVGQMWHRMEIERGWFPWASEC